MELAKNVETNGHNTGTSGKDGHGSTNADMHASDTEAEMLSCWWCAPVHDTGCLQPLKQTHGFSWVVTVAASGSNTCASGA